MENTPKLGLPFIMPSQAQKHVTHNEALKALDAVVQLATASRSAALPPPAPAEGERHIVASPASGVWTGHEGDIAAFQDGAWEFHPPQIGWRAWVADEGALFIWSGADWTPLSGSISALQDLDLLGVGTIADAANPFSAKLNKALWTAATLAEGGDGDLRYTMNKESDGDVLSLLMQSGYSGRAEIGLVGNDDLSVRVSADGSAWKDALAIDRTAGTASFPAGLTHTPSGAALNGLVFTPGGDGQVSVWRNDTTRAKDPRTAAIASVSGDILTLSTADAGLFFQNTQMQGVSWLRIWNTSRTAPGEPAWVKSAPAGDQLQVVDAAMIAGWTTGETVQIGDPTPDIAPTRSFAIDISPMLQNVLGAVFPQSGVLAKLGVQGNAAAVGLAVSGTAEGGSFLSASSLSDGTLNNGMVIVPTPTLSPVSNSNLLFVREDAVGAGDLHIALMSVIGVFG